MVRADVPESCTAGRRKIRISLQKRSVVEDLLRTHYRVFRSSLRFSPTYPRLQEAQKLVQSLGTAARADKERKSKPDEIPTAQPLRCAVAERVMAAHRGKCSLWRSAEQGAAAAAERVLARLPDGGVEDQELLRRRAFHPRVLRAYVIACGYGRPRVCPCLCACTSAYERSVGGSCREGFKAETLGGRQTLGGIGWQEERGE